MNIVYIIIIIILLLLCYTICNLLFCWIVNEKKSLLIPANLPSLHSVHLTCFLIETPA